MGIEAAITALVGVASMLGGFVGGRRTAGNESIEIAQQTVELLQSQVGSIKDTLREREDKLAELIVKVQVLEALVTQRADVEAVKEVVDRIALKVDA